MRKHLLYLLLMVLIALGLSPCIFSQTTESARFDPEEYFGRYGYITPEIPQYFHVRSTLGPGEMHILDTLTRNERLIIEDAFDPPAVGIIRDLNPIIQFNLAEIEIPESGEISTSGGRLTRINEDILVFTTRIQSTKADELRLFFAEGNFPYGVKVNLFSQNDYAFTQPELRGKLDEYGFYTTTTFADYIDLQIVIPLDIINGNLYFTISKIIHADNRYMPEEDPTRSCFLDANCADANSYTHISAIRNATARLFFPSEGKYGLCSGGLLNDARGEDWQPFLLTANHCFSTQASAAGLEARFNYWSTYCNSGVVNPSHIIINGANLISTNSQTDFTLVLLKHPSSNYYLGWDAGSVANNTTMHSTHHPGGTLMKYQRMTNKTSPSHSCGGFSTSDFYYTKTTHGQEEPGSSGGLIVDPLGRVRGQLYGWCYEAGADRCNYDTYNNMWGRFDKSYSINNLGYWLYNGGSSVAISTSPGSSYNYGTENIGSYDDHVFTINNSGTRPNYLNLETSNAYISGADASQFSVIGASSQYLAPGESGTFTVRFTPTSTGKKTATLNIPHNADNYGSPKQITLTGYGNPCSDIISLGGGGSQNTNSFSKSGEGAWESDFCGFSCYGNEQVYSFTAPQTGTYSIEITSTNNTWVDYFWKTGSCASTSWNCINDVYSPSTQGLMNWTAGTTYYILLDAEGTSTATHSFYVFLNPCSDIENISGTGSGNAKTYPGGGYGSWYTSSASPCGYLCEGQEQIYSFVAPQTGNYAIQVTAGGNWVDYMWKTGSCSGTDWQCIDDIYYPGLYGEMYWTAGETYYLLLDDEDNTASNHIFHIELTEALGTWTGTVSTNWHTAGNWSFNTIPTSGIDVTIPAGTPYQPFVQSANAFCNNITINDGATLTLGGFSLTANGNANCEGTVVMDQQNANFSVYGDITWQSSSTLVANQYLTFINVYGTWDAKNGSDLNPGNGFVDFKGSNNGFIRSYDPDNKFYNLRIFKTGGAYLGLSVYSTEPLRVENLIYVSPGSIFNNYDNEDIILEGFFHYYGTFDMTFNNNSSSFIFDGENPVLDNFDSGSGIFNNVVFSASNQATAYSDFQVAKNLTIEEGTFNANEHTVSVAGNWTNSVGPDGFIETNSRVIFNGPGHQYVFGDEHFNILEVANGAALRVNNSSYDVSCNTYDWTSGGIDVVAGNFTANDLADNGLWGTYWCNPNGTLTLTQDGSQYVDLNGEIHIFGGTMTVNGGLGSSYWPFQNDAVIVMTGGVLDFPDSPIRLHNGSYTLTEDITGGTIKTQWSFWDYRGDFTPAGGMVELYGSADAQVLLTSGSNFYNLNINKVPAEGSSSSQNNFVQYRDRTKASISRANKITATSDLLINENLTIDAGTFDVSSYEVTVGNDVSIYGTIAMTDPAGDLTANFIEWFAGSEDNVTAGTFHADNWRFNEGTNAMIGAGNTAFVKNLYYTLDDNAEFGNLIALPLSKLPENPDSRAYYPTRVSGDFTIQSGASWSFYQPDAGIIVNGHATIEDGAYLGFSQNEFVVDGNITIAGTLDVSNEAVATVHGEISWPETGEVIINSNAEVIFDAPNHPDKGWEYIYGHLTLTEGLFEISNNSANFGATATTNVSGGTIKTGGAFRAVDPNVFEPTGGVVEITGTLPDVAIYCYGGNYFYNLVINREPGNYCQFSGSPVEIKNDFSIVSGTLNTSFSDMFVGGNWTNNVGPNGFVENQNEVWFYGETYSHIFTDETFYDLYIFDYLTDGQPANGSKIVDETYIEDGVNVHATNNCRILGGSLNMGNSSVLDVDNNLIFNGGQLIVPNGTPADIFVGGHYQNFNPGQAFFPGQSTITFDGAIDQDVTSNASIVYFNNLVIDNPGYFVKFDVNTHNYGDVHAINGIFVSVGLSHTNTFEGDINVEPLGAFIPKGVINFEGTANTVFNDQSTITSYLWGDVYVDKAADNLELLIADNMFILNGYSIDVLTGIVDLNGSTLRCTENVIIHDGGKIIVDPGAVLEVGEDNELNVNNGGVLEVIGSSGNPAIVTAHNATLGHRYFFNIESGGTISASHAIFEYMKYYRGVNVQTGAIIDPVNCFNFCTFRHGDESASATAFLTINNNQNLTITGAVFPEATMEFNVAKEDNTGHITFVDFSGTFAGEDYDFDPHNLIDWYTPTLEAIPLVRNVGAPAGSTTFDVISSLDWTAGESSGWFSITPTFGTGNTIISVNYDENVSAVPRSGEITLSADGVPDVIVTVNQAGADHIISIVPPNRNVSAEAGITTFSVEANPGWTWYITEAVPWLSVNPMSGSGNATLTVNYGENATGSARIGLIELPGGVSATVTQVSYPEHLISLNSGWQGVSSYIMPANNDIGDVFDPLLPDFIIAQTMAEIYYPAGPVNTIFDWESQSAYKVKMAAPANLSVMGNEESNKTFALADGWNLVPVICNEPVDAAGLFAGTSLTLLKDVAGLGIYWPAMGINTLGDMLPGKAYFALSGVGTITFPANAKMTWNESYPEVKFPAHPWNEIATGPSSHTIGILQKAISFAMPGDVIGVFDENGNCFGAALVDKANESMALSAFGNDQLVAQKSGFTTGEAMKLQLFRPATAGVFDLEVEWDEALPNGDTFATEGISVIAGLKLSTTRISNQAASAVQLFPNPTTGMIVISGLKDFQQVEIFNSAGNLLMTLSIDGADKLSVDLSPMPAGIYQVRLSGSQATVVKKLIRN